MFTEQFHSLLSSGWKDVFSQERTLHRAIEHAVATPCSLGRRTISRTICALNRQQQDWSADYKMFSRSNWSEDNLFSPVIPNYLKRYPKGPVAVGFDDTKLAKCGRKIKSAFWQRDPMSPPFHTNLIFAQRFIQASMLFPHHQEGDYDARSIPVRFREAPSLKKPGKRANKDRQEEYKKAKKHFNLSTQTLEVIYDIRSEIDAAGGYNRQMFSVLDGSFCNRTIFRADLNRIDLIARCRKDAKLCMPAKPDGRRKYSADKFTPEQVRKDERIAWKETKVRFGGKIRKVRYKHLTGLLWQRGAGLKLLSFIVIAPRPYKLSPHSRTHYRQPAYLLSTDCESSTKVLIQAYLDRWQIEVNHRDEKSILGVGQAQVHSENSVSRHPAFVVASYSMMLLASLEEFGPERTDDFAELPKWRKNAKRPSVLDLITLLRKEINETHFSGHLNYNFYHLSKNLTKYAYT
jgi:hypothetical protein